MIKRSKDTCHNVKIGHGDCMKTLFLLVIIVAVYIAYKKSTQGAKARTIGKAGESEIVEIIKHSGIQGSIFTNVYIPFKNGKTTEIDVIFLTDKKMYIIESKNYSGKVYGAPDRHTWTVCYRNGSKYPFYNPISQNETHVNALVNALGVNVRCIDPIVVFGSSADISDVEKESNVMAIKDMMAYIHRDQQRSRVCFTANELSTLKRYVTNLTKVSNATKRKHIKDIKDKYN